MGRGAVDMKPEAATVAVAIDRDKGSQYAIKWAVDNLFTRGQLITLLHVKQTLPPLSPHSNHRAGGTLSTSQGREDAENVYKRPTDPQTKELFLPFRSYCTKKLHIKCKDVVAEAPDIPTTLINYVISNSIEILVLGAASRNGFFKSFKTTDVPSSVVKRIPDFCSVYVIGKSKISYVQTASAAAPHRARNQIQKQWSDVSSDHSAESPRKHKPRALERRTQSSPPSQLMVNDAAEIKSVRFRRARARGSSTSNSYDFSREMETESISDISSFASSERPSVDSNMFPNSSLYDSDYSIISMSSSATSPRQSTSNSEFDDRSSLSSSYSRHQYLDMTSSPYAAFSSSSTESGRSSAGTSASHNNMDDVKAEMRRLKQELKQTMEMYNKACKEAITSRHKAKELDRWKWEEEGRLLEALSAEEAALAAIEKEKAKCKAAAEAAEAALRIAELEAQNRINAERKVVQEIHENQNKALELQGRSRAYYYNNINNHNNYNNYLSLRYRKYTIEEIEEATNNFSEGQKIGEGGYGPVYRGQIDHTQVAVKVLRSDAEQGRSQFQKEVEILSCIRHPNMVLLLGACPEKACLVYEYLANGSLEDRLFRRGNTPPIPWQVRFRIAAEISTGLLFLHQSKPEPLVHRDLKPANILLDRNYVSKISDVGLARLVPPSVSDSVTQFRMTSAAGTFCYIDPEYQQTGMLGTKSDVYSLGIMLLQLLTAKRAMGLTHRVEMGIELGTFAEMLDPAVHDWPVEEATEFAKLGLRCAELRRKDRPDLAEVVVPQLNRFRQLADQHFRNIMPGGGGGGYYSSSITSSQSSSSISPKQEVRSDVLLPRSG